MQSNLLKRVITASIIFPLVISIILYQNDLIVRLFLNIVIFLAAFELSRLCFTENSGNRKSFIFITIVFICKMVFMSLLSIRSFSHIHFCSFNRNFLVKLISFSLSFLNHHPLKIHVSNFDAEFVRLRI